MVFPLLQIQFYICFCVIIFAAHSEEEMWYQGLSFLLYWTKESKIQF